MKKKRRSAVIGLSGEKAGRRYFVPAFSASVLRPLCAGFIVILGFNSGVDAQLYRYINEKGVPVIDDAVPPEFVANGYDVLRNDGTLLHRVDRQLTDEELTLRNTDEAKARMRKEEEARLQAWDDSLLRRYSGTEDIKAAQDRAMRDLQIRISILKSNLHTTKSQIEREQKKAADMERRGSQVPEEMTKNIDILRLEIEDIEQSIIVRKEEISSVKAAFERDIERFKTLQDRVNMRKQSSSTSEASSKKPGH